jgi:hypothetical protein
VTTLRAGECRRNGDRPDPLGFRYRLRDPGGLASAAPSGTGRSAVDYGLKALPRATTDLSDASTTPSCDGWFTDRREGGDLARRQRESGIEESGHQVAGALDRGPVAARDPRQHTNPHLNRLPVLSGTAVRTPHPLSKFVHRPDFGLQVGRWLIRGRAASRVPGGYRLLTVSTDRGEREEEP